MNKVINIQLSSQIFWIDELAYQTLDEYLNTLRRQLHGQESAQDIYDDIEHYLCELLFDISDHGKKSLNASHIQVVMEQVGFLDDEALEPGPEPRLGSEPGPGLGSGLEPELEPPLCLIPEAKILGGVCASLANRWSVAVLLIRAMFIVLIPVFGLGIIIYALLWLFLDDSAKRDAFLMAKGKQPTAKLMAKVEEPSLKQQGRLASLMLSPFIASARVFAWINSHYRQYFGYYRAIAKGLGWALLGLVNVAVVDYLLNFFERRLFELPINMLMVISVVVLVIMLNVMVAQVYLLSNRTFNRTFNHNKVIMITALIPLGVLTWGIYYLEDATSYEHRLTTEKSFNIDGNKLQVMFANDARPSDADDLGKQQSFINNHITLVVQATAAQQEAVKVSLDYFSRGNDLADALHNIHSISYVYKVVDQQLILDPQLFLTEGALYRGQALVVRLHIPADFLLILPTGIEIVREENGGGIQSYSYHLATGVNPVEIPSGEAGEYLSVGGYLHAVGPWPEGIIGPNEFVVLQQAFCQTFFVGPLWQCHNNIKTPVAVNRRLNLAFQDQINSIEALRQLLKQRTQIDRQQLLNIQTSLKNILGDQIVDHPLAGYLQHLLHYQSIYMK